jgi:hypothetical protein
LRVEDILRDVVELVEDYRMISRSSMLPGWLFRVRRSRIVDLICCRKADS